MDEFIVIKVMNEAMLKLLKNKKENYIKNEKLKEYLRDEALFFKIDKERALKVLTMVGVTDEKLEETYEKLTTKEVYDKLIKKEKIKPNDKLIIKYN